MESRPQYPVSVAAEGMSNDPAKKPRETPEVGPRGGLATRQDGRVKKTRGLDEDEAHSVRAVAYEEHRSEASIIREAIRRYLDIED